MAAGAAARLRRLVPKAPTDKVYTAARRAAKTGAYVASVDLREGESPEHLITRFRQAVQRDGILREIKQRRHFIPKSERRRIARAKAARRRRRQKKVA